MNTKRIDDGGPAFPVEVSADSEGWLVGRQTGSQSGFATGLSIRQYAAIKLKVPNSGTDWLDEMIRQSLRDDFAAKAMQCFLGDDYRRTETILPEFHEFVSANAYETADAMMKARAM